MVFVYPTTVTSNTTPRVTVEVRVRVPLPTPYDSHPSVLPVVETGQTTTGVQALPPLGTLQVFVGVLVVATEDMVVEEAWGPVPVGTVETVVLNTGVRYGSDGGCSGPLPGRPFVTTLSAP